MYRSSRLEVFCKKDALRNFKNSQENSCARVFPPATLLRNRIWHRCFPVNFEKFLRTPFLTEHLLWLLVHVSREPFSQCQYIQSKFLQDSFKAAVTKISISNISQISLYFH